MNFKNKYVNNNQVNWKIQVQKYRKGLMVKCNYGLDKEIDPYEEDDYGIDSSDYDSDEDPGYELGKPTRHASKLFTNDLVGRVPLKARVRQLLNDNFEESDSDEYVRWEKQKKYNKRKRKRYLKACHIFP